MTGQKLIEIVDIFRCCIFTWGAVTTVLPAFFIAGAIATFVPVSSITKFLGAKTNKWISLSIASCAGYVIPVCSCNIVPLFASILKKGGGIGPAFTLLYAGAAVHIISIIFVYKIIGPILAFWRIIGVTITSIAIGILMPILFKDNPIRSPNGTETPQEPLIDAIEMPKKKNSIVLLFVMLFLILGIGSTVGNSVNSIGPDKFMLQKIISMILLSFALVFLVTRYFPKESVLSWLDEVWRLLKSIIPILIPSVLIIGIISVFIDIRWVHDLFSAQKDALGNRLFFPTLRSTFLATLFGELMYFPILTEVVFVKAFLKLGIDIGPALGILLAGPGTSLPGFLLIYKFTGFKKVLAYFTISLIMETIIAVTLSMYLGDYICACLIAK
ncbi:MAG: permease [Candidatus Omnitrophota bacterium]|nr:permease [Candidatus Omnitrophota bacterium]